MKKRPEPAKSWEGKGKDSDAEVVRDGHGHPVLSAYVGICERADAEERS